MPSLQAFDYSGQQVRTVIINGEPGFIANDLCAVLDLHNPRQAMSYLDADEKGVTTNDTPGGAQQMAYVTEAGMYSLVLRSRKPEARAFKRWLTHEVLPALRKTGSYQMDPRSQAELLTRADLAKMILESEEEKSILAAALESATPAIEYHDRYVANDDAVTVKVWAAQFGLTDPQARQLLLDRKVVYRTCIGERFSAKAGKVVREYEYRPYAERLEWFDLRPQHNAPRHHNGQVRQTLYVRQQFALDLGKKLGVKPLSVQSELEIQQ